MRWYLRTLNGRLPALRPVDPGTGEAPRYIASLCRQQGDQESPTDPVICELDFGYGRPTDLDVATLIALAPALLASVETDLQHDDWAVMPPWIEDALTRAKRLDPDW